ncbi:MAG: RHS repeat-associated core domain-containing protein [Bacteroidales bacterium]|nr:RHS repeat-associated core domain-containing protein [Bacteroidales bacterium]
MPRRRNATDCNGKEKDYESGFHYYGARYYWSELLTGWLSVDPMSDKYPSMSPYAYCAWNPVKLVDPDGEWPRNPKHIRQAKRFANKNDGALSVWTEKNGVRLASVVCVERTNPCEVSVSITLFQPEGYDPRGGIRQASGFANAEMWMDSPAENAIDAVAKGAANIAYGVLNDISKLITGKTIAGSEVTATEKADAFAETAASCLSPALKGSRVVTSTKAKNGLQGYNEFIKKNPGIIKRLSRKSAGNAFRQNMQLQQEVKDFDKTIGGIQVIKEVRNDVVE